MQYRLTTTVERLYDDIQSDMYRFKTATMGVLTAEQAAMALQHAYKLQDKIAEAIQLLEEGVNKQ